MSSDFAIAQFRFLERLLLVHGHWCYRRISMMVQACSSTLEANVASVYYGHWYFAYGYGILNSLCMPFILIWLQICYFFYKNITFGFTLFWFEARASFSGQPAYNDWYMAFYNVFFTSLPVIALGVFDQDVSARHCLKVKPCYFYFGAASSPTKTTERCGQL